MAYMMGQDKELRDCERLGIYKAWWTEKGGKGA